MRRSTTPRVCRWRNHHLRNSSRLPISESRLFSRTLRPAIRVKDCEMVWLRGVAVIEAECPSEPLLPMNNSGALPFVGVRDDQPVVEALMISLCVVQLDNEIPILPSQKSSTIHGIPITAIPGDSRQTSTNGRTRSAGRKRWTRER